MWLPDEPGPGGLGIEVDDDAVAPLSRRSRGGRVTGAAWSAPDLVRRHAARAGDEPAITVGSDVVTWAGLDRRVDALADELRSSGVPEGGVVAFTGEPTVETVVRVLAVLRAGGVAASLPVGADRGGARRGDARTRARHHARERGGPRHRRPAARRARRRGPDVGHDGAAEGRGAVRARAGGQRGRLARGAAARDGLAPGAGPGARGRPRRPVARDRVGRADADRRRLRTGRAGRCHRLARGQPRVARPDAARPAARRGRGGAAAGQPPRGAARRRDRPARRS